MGSVWRRLWRNFLLTVCQNTRNRMMAERFQHSGETISNHFYRVLKALCRYSRHIIMLVSLSETPPKVRHNPRYYPRFEKCIGAIDETHVSAYAPARKQTSYHGRKVLVTQNVMCTCSFDMTFTFVYTGWEGTVNNSIFTLFFFSTQSNPSINFSMPTDGMLILFTYFSPNTDS